MFEWCTGSTLRAMVDAGVVNAADDDWLEGWLFALMQHRFVYSTPLHVLDIVHGAGDRPYVEHLRGLGADVDSLPAADLTGPAPDPNAYGLVIFNSLEREQCLGPIDFENPLSLLSMLIDAVSLVAPGGMFVWSHLYCFPRDADHVHSYLEPASIYQAIVRRKLQPLSGDNWGKERVAIEHDSDTIFVRPRAVLSCCEQFERITRFCCGVRRPGNASRVSYLAPGAP